MHCYVMPEGSTRALTQSGIGEAINIFLLILLRKGYVRSASYLQVIAFWFSLQLRLYRGRRAGRVVPVGVPACDRVSREFCSADAWHWA
jgi:hypothetical protein